MHRVLINSGKNMNIYSNLWSACSVSTDSLKLVSFEVVDNKLWAFFSFIWDLFKFSTFYQLLCKNLVKFEIAFFFLIVKSAVFFFSSFFVALVLSSLLLKFVPPPCEQQQQNKPLSIGRNDLAIFFIDANHMLGSAAHPQECMFLINMAPFRKEINRLSNCLRFIAKIIYKTQIHKLFVLSLEHLINTFDTAGPFFMPCCHHQCHHFRDFFFLLMVLSLQISCCTQPLHLAPKVLSKLLFL